MFAQLPVPNIDMLSLLIILMRRHCEPLGRGNLMQRLDYPLDCFVTFVPRNDVHNDTILELNA